MEERLLDTNILILHLSNQFVLPATGYRWFVSTLTVFELLRYPGLSERETSAIRTLLTICDQLTVTSAVAERAATIAKTHRGNAIDLLIAGTALEHHLPLVTKNIKDFRHLPGLIVYNTIDQREQS